ncbi:MAG: Gfo/Idh/MocA family oxidoreductase, partial [Candidatus Stahlbacteria bacterium]|nr:Gfo/Idh/MocA family oxidoreductase [Candidatus Stahlbacteria bacterium]
GCGYWGPNLIRNFHSLGVLHTICDKDSKRLSQVSRIYPEICATPDVCQAIDSSDAVVITTSAESHYELAKQSLLAGKDVFVEKPLTLRVSEGEELLELSIKNSRILMVGHLLLYHPAIRKIREYIRNGTLGDIYYTYSQRLNLGKIKQDENALWSFGPHDISVVLYLIGKIPNKVIAVGASYLQAEIPDVVFLTLHFDNDIVSNIHLSWLDPHKVRKITIVGSKQMVVFDDMASTEQVRLYDKGVDYKPDFKSYAEALTLRSGDIVIPNIGTQEPLKLECKHFVECVQNRTTPISDGANGLAVVRILESAQLSLTQGGIPVEL